MSLLKKIIIILSSLAVIITGVYHGFGYYKVGQVQADVNGFLDKQLPGHVKYFYDYIEVNLAMQQTGLKNFVLYDTQVKKILIKVKKVLLQISCLLFLLFSLLP